MHPRLSPGLEAEIRRLIGRGHGKRAVARMIGVSKHAVLNVLARGPHPKLTAWDPAPARLSLREREEIRVGLERTRRLRPSPCRSGGRCRPSPGRSPRTAAETDTRRGGRTGTPRR